MPNDYGFKMPTVEEDFTKRSFGERVKDTFSNLLEPEGAATGALGAFLFGGPVGLALGITQGVLAKRMRKTALEEAAAERQMLSGVDTLFNESLNKANSAAATDTDRLQLEEVGRQYKIQRKLSLSPDPQTRQAAIRNLGEMGTYISTFLEDIESREETLIDGQVQILEKQSEVARTNFEAGLKTSQDYTEKGERIHSILASDVDINSGPVRAELASLMGTSARELLADPEDLRDYIIQAGGKYGVIGDIVAGFQAAEKGGEFKFTKEQWRTVAYAMQVAGKRKGEQTMQDAQRIGTMLDKASTGIGQKRVISYLDSIITGKVQDAPQVSGESGAYGTGVAADNAPPAPTIREKASAAVEEAKDKIKGAVSSPILDPTGFFKQFILGEELPPDDPRRKWLTPYPTHGRNRRPTN